MSSSCAARYALIWGLPGWVTVVKLTQVMDALELIRDFVNTADLEEGTDKLVDARGLQYWLVFHGLAELRHRATDEEAAEARAVREALRDLLSAHTGVEVDRDVASRTLDIAARNAGLAVRFVDGTIAFVPEA